MIANRPDSSPQLRDWADEWHGDLVKFLARRTASSADAQDLAQEVYLRLLRVERLDLIRKPRSYLLRIGANLLHEWRLKANQARPHSAEGLAELVASEDPEVETARDMRTKRLAAELRKLSPAIRAALILQVHDGLTYQQIAVQMQVTPRMIKRYLLEGYARLRSSVPPDI